MLLRSAFDIGGGTKLSQCPVIESSVNTWLIDAADLFCSNYQFHSCCIREDGCFDVLQTQSPCCRQALTKCAYITVFSGLHQIALLLNSSSPHKINNLKKDKQIFMNFIIFFLILSYKMPSTSYHIIHS